MSCLIIAEQDGALLNRASLATISAALEITKDIDLVVTNPESIESIKKIKDINKIYTFKSKPNNVLAENLVNFLSDIVPKYNYLLAPSGTFSKNFIPRLGAILNLQPISN